MVIGASCSSIVYSKTPYAALSLDAVSAPLKRPLMNDAAFFITASGVVHPNLFALLLVISH